MFRNYLLIACRNLLRHKVYSMINISGLAIGIACSLLMLLFVFYELSYDRFHRNAERICRVLVEVQSPFGNQSSFVPAPLGPALVEQMPEIVQSVRFFKQWRDVVGYGTRHFYEERFYFADTSVFDVFDFPLIQGMRQDDPFTLVLTQDAAQRYFGAENPIGRVLTLNHKYDFTVTGVVENVPSNAHFTFDFLASFESLRTIDNGVLNWFSGSGRHLTYLLIQEGSSVAEIEKKVMNWVVDGGWPNAKPELKISLQSLTRIHLHSPVSGESGSIREVYLFSAIAGLIVLIACVNFVNISTARSVHRGREVGLRKVLGAHRLQIANQFLGESTLICAIAFVLALGLAEVSLPVFNAYTRLDLTLAPVATVSFWLAFVGLALGVGMLSGIYPALLMASTLPVQAFKGAVKAGSGSAFVRKTLVVFQFAVSIGLMVCTVVIYRQMDYLQNKDLGFEKAGLIWFSFPNQDQVLRNQFEVLKQALMQSPHIVQVSSAGMMPFEAYGAVELTVAGEKVWLNRLMIDADFIETFGMTLISGRNFSRDATDRSALILNETAIKTFGMKGEMGEHPPWTESHQLIGVVKDFHLASLHTPIAPVALSLGPGRAGDKVIVRIQPEQATEALAFIKEKWEAFAPGYPFEVVFFDDIYEGKYHAEQRLKRLVTWFSLVAMFIAGLGLWGLAAFASERRIKEIGIRKVMGASVVGIVALLSKDFLKLVALAMGIAWAVAYYVMDLYLQGFAYRVILSMDIFLLCGLAALLIAQLTVSYQAVRAALTNPVDALRYE